MDAFLVHLDMLYRQYRTFFRRHAKYAHLKLMLPVSFICPLRFFAAVGLLRERIFPWGLSEIVCNPPVVHVSIGGRSKTPVQKQVHAVERERGSK